MRPDQYKKKLSIERDIERELDSGLSEWVLKRTNSRSELYRCYRFDSFERVIEFISLVAAGPISEQDHHPRWQNNYNTLDVWLTTHDSGDQVTGLDLCLAKSMELLWLSFFQRTDF